MSAPLTFLERRALALQVLTVGEKLTRKSGSFLGQCVVDDHPLSDKQIDWFTTLAERAGVPIAGELQ